MYFISVFYFFMNHNWQQLFHEGREYFYNSLTNQSQWTRPDDYRPKPPPKREYCIYSKELTNDWSILLTNLNHELFYNKKTKESTWEIPMELMELISILLQEADSDQEGADDVQEEVNDTEIIEDEKLDQLHEAIAEKSSMEEQKVEKKRCISVEPVADTDLISDTKKPKIDLESSIKEYKLILDQTNPFSSYNIEAEKHNFAKFNLPKNISKKLFEEHATLKSKELIESKKASQKSSIDKFVELLNEKVLKKQRYEDFKRIYRKNVNFIDTEESKSLFLKHIATLGDHDYQRKKQEYMELLREVVKTKDQSWVETRLLIQENEKYLAIPTLVQREDIFRKFLETL